MYLELGPIIFRVAWEGDRVRTRVRRIYHRLEAEVGWFGREQISPIGLCIHKKSKLLSVCMCVCVWGGGGGGGGGGADFDP